MSPFPDNFALTWLDAWNRHDVEAVLALFAEDAVFTSPFAAKILPDTQGRLLGKAALREYWNIGIQKVPDLHFTLEATFSGVDTMVILSRNQNGACVSEVLKFRDDLVIEGHGTYSA